MRNQEESVSPLWYVVAGAIMGVGVATLLVSTEDEDGNQTSMFSKLFKKIPTSVKVAGGFGAIRGAGRQAGREISESVEEQISDRG